MFFMDALTRPFSIFYIFLGCSSPPTLGTRRAPGSWPPSTSKTTLRPSWLRSPNLRQIIFASKTFTSSTAESSLCFRTWEFRFGTREPVAWFRSSPFPQFRMPTDSSVPLISRVVQPISSFSFKPTNAIKCRANRRWSSPPTNQTLISD